MGLIYNLNSIITVPLLFIMLYTIGKMSLKPKERNIYIIIFIGIIVANVFILRDYSEVKSSHNYSTYLTYENMFSMFKDVERYEINDVSDIEDFSIILEGLRNQSFLLGSQLKHSILLKKGNDILKDNLYSLSDELHKFIIYHNRLYANSIDIIDDSIPLYNGLKISISEFGNQIKNQGGNQGGNVMGVVEYNINLIEQDLSELKLIMDTIAKINLSIIKE